MAAGTNNSINSGQPLDVTQSPTFATLKLQSGGVGKLVLNCPSSLPSDTDFTMQTVGGVSIICNWTGGTYNFNQSLSTTDNVLFNTVALNYVPGFKMTMQIVDSAMANRTLSWVFGDANRAITLQGDLVIGSNFSTSIGTGAITLTSTGVTNSTLPLGTTTLVPTTGTGATGTWGIDITGTAPAGTLTGTALASNVVTSSLTDFGTVNNVTVVNGGAVRTEATNGSALYFSAYDVDGAVYQPMMYMVAGNTPSLFVTNGGGAGTLIISGAVIGSVSMTMGTNGFIGFNPGCAIRTSQTIGDNWFIQAYDTDNAVQRTFITLTAGVIPTMAISAPAGGSATMDAVVIGATTPAAATVTILTASGLATLSSGRVDKKTTVTAAGTYTVLTTDYYIIINKSVAAANTVTLPAASGGQTFTIKDGKGDAATNNITVNTASGNIDGAASVLLNTNFGALTFTSDGTNYFVS